MYYPYSTTNFHSNFLTPHSELTVYTLMHNLHVGGHY